MACKSCTETSYKTAFYGPYPECSNYACSDNCPQVVDTSCVVYTGPQLVNLDLDTNICLEDILQQIDQKLIVVSGNYAGYDTFCLAPITTQQEFVEIISEYVCQTRTTLDTFITVTYASDIDNIEDQIADILAPGVVSCASVGIVNTDDLPTVLQKLATNECNIYSMLNLSTANWNSCFTIVGTPPTTPLEATNALLAQICSIKNAQTSGVLPTFDNTNTCLSGGTVSDSLVTTIGLLRNRLCQTPIININDLTFGCISKPSNNALDLQGTLQSILTKLDVLTKNAYTFNPAQFSTILVDPGNQCLGLQVSLTGSGGGGGGTDRFVAATATDIFPSTLIDKLAEGVGINLDFSNPAQCVIGIDPSYQPTDEKVKASSSDPTTGFLDQKLKATGDPAVGLTMAASFDSLDNKVNVTGSINPTTLAQAILEAIQDDSELQAIFCAIVNACPVACTPPTNASVTFQ